MNSPMQAISSVGESLHKRREESLDTEIASKVNAGREGRSGSFLGIVCGVLASAGCYYIATRIAWSLCFPDSKVSLFFPPHAVLVSILLLVPTRQWWAYTLAAAGAHFLATQQAHWPTLYALHCEVFDAVQNVAAAGGIRLLIKSPIKALTLRDAIIFVLVAVVLVPFGTAFWGAAFTVSNGFGTRYWIEWRNLGISNAVTAVVLVPVFLLGAYHLLARRPEVTWRRALEAALVGACTVAVGEFVFDQTHAGPGTSPALRRRHEKSILRTSSTRGESRDSYPRRPRGLRVHLLRPRQVPGRPLEPAHVVGAGSHDNKSMSRKRVIWSEGLFLRPQHFQQLERSVEMLVESRAAGMLVLIGFGVRLALERR